MASVTVYFSLPFYPVRRKTRFYNGHLAVAVNGTVYQAFDPARLRSSFLVSAMPEGDWLYGKSRLWCHTDASGEKYRHVYLYGCGEAHRTKVYFVRFDGIDPLGAAAAIRRAGDIERAFAGGERRFGIVRYNCALFVRELLEAAFECGRGWGDFIPAALFRRLVDLARSETRYALGSVSRQYRAFRTHSFCLGLPGFNPEAFMDSFLGESGRFSCMAADYPEGGDNVLAT